MQINKKLVIITPDGNKKISELNNDEYNNYCIELAKSNNLSVVSTNDTTIYLPSIITEEQYRYLLERKIALYRDKKTINVVSILPNNEIKNIVFQYDDNQLEKVYQEISKNYIPNNDSFILIVPNENKLVIENGIYFKEFDTNIGNAKMFQLFCMLYMIPIKVPEITGNPWAKELANNSFLVVKREKDEIYTFIPKDLSVNQYNWLINNKEFLSSFDQLEAAIYLNNGGYKEVFKDEEYGKRKIVLELIDEIYQEVELKKESIKKKVRRCTKN